ARTPTKAPQPQTRTCARRKAIRPFRGAPMKNYSTRTLTTRPIHPRKRLVNEAFKRIGFVGGGGGARKLLDSFSRVWGPRIPAHPRGYRRIASADAKGRAVHPARHQRHTAGCRAGSHGAGCFGDPYAQP